MHSGPSCLRLTSKYSIREKGRSSSGYARGSPCDAQRAVACLKRDAWARRRRLCAWGIHAPPTHPGDVCRACCHLALAGGAHIQLDCRVQQAWKLHAERVEPQRHIRKGEAAVGQHKRQQSLAAGQLEHDFSIGQRHILCEWRERGSGSRQAAAGGSSFEVSLRCCSSREYSEWRDTHVR
jgi:hypothetical protein